MIRQAVHMLCLLKRSCAADCANGRDSHDCQQTPRRLQQNPGWSLWVSFLTCPPCGVSPTACTFLSTSPTYSALWVTLCSRTESTPPVATLMRTRSPRNSTPLPTTCNSSPAGFRWQATANLPCYHPLLSLKHKSCARQPVITSCVHKTH